MCLFGDFGYPLPIDYETYRRSYFVDPPPAPRFRFERVGGVSLYVREYGRALAFYEAVLGPPAYVEGEWTRGWPIGHGWLTLFPAQTGGPANMDVTLEVSDPGEVARLYEAFIAAGATGDAPSDQLMYAPVRYASVNDPFGAVIVIVSPLEQE